MVTKKSLLGRMLIWRNDTRDLHAHLCKAFGMPFPEENLLQIVDSHLKIGGEGQAKAHKKPRGSGKTTLTSMVKAALGSKPLLAREVHAKMGNSKVTSDQVVKTLAQLFLKRDCKRVGKAQSYKYYLK